MNLVVSSLLLGACGGVVGFWFQDLLLRSSVSHARSTMKGPVRLQMIALYAIAGFFTSLILSLWLSRDGELNLPVAKQIVFQLMTGFSAVPILSGIRSRFIRAVLQGSERSDLPDDQTKV